MHSAHVQVFAELGFFGAAVWAGLFAYAFVACLRIRARSKTAHLAPGDQRLLFTVANALIVSMTGFLVGGSFLALALNDITWLTFGIVAAADRISLTLCADQATDLATVVQAAAEVPLAFRVVDSFGPIKGVQR